MSRSACGCEDLAADAARPNEAPACHRRALSCIAQLLLLHKKCQQWGTFQAVTLIYRLGGGVLLINSSHTMQQPHSSLSWLLLNYLLFAHANG